jgi:hypothetical protein
MLCWFLNLLIYLTVPLPVQFKWMRSRDECFFFKANNIKSVVYVYALLVFIYYLLSCC